jgi:hypothetical protein
VLAAIFPATSFKEKLNKILNILKIFGITGKKIEN